MITRPVASLVATVCFMSTIAWGEPLFRATPVLETSTTHGGQKLSYPRIGEAKLTSLIVELAPGEETGQHKELVPTFVYVLEGSLIIEVENGGRHEYQAGQGFIEVVDTWHNARNTGQTPMRLLAVFIGEEGKANTIFPDQQ